MKGRGKQNGIIETVSGKEVRADILPKTKIEIVAKDANVKEVTDIIVKTACNRYNRRRKNIRLHHDGVIRVRTGERGHNAI